MVLSEAPTFCYFRQDWIINHHELSCLVFVDTVLWVQCPTEYYISQNRDIEATVCCPHLKKTKKVCMCLTARLMSTLPMTLLLPFPLPFSSMLKSMPRILNALIIDSCSHSWWKLQWMVRIPDLQCNLWQGHPVSHQKLHQSTSSTWWKELFSIWASCGDQRMQAEGMSKYDHLTNWFFANKETMLTYWDKSWSRITFTGTLNFDQLPLKPLSTSVFFYHLLQC